MSQPPGGPLRQAPSRVEQLYCPTCEECFASGTRCPKDGATLIPLQGAVDQLIGRTLADRFTIKERLGVGAMGVVYRALQLSVGREVAIKILNTNIVTEPDAIKRFLREAKLTSRLFHPNAVATLDFGRTDDGLFFLVMELAHGRTLRELLDDEGKLPTSRVVRIGAQICDALAAAHEKGIVHRDLKPSNIMVSSPTPDTDHIKVFDFGVAKSLRADATRVTSAGTVLGTPMYLPPEVARGEAVDGRSDIYSLGAILYEMASGKPPFRATTLARLIALHAEAEPEPIAEVPKAVSDAILALLAKRPEDRPHDAAAARALLLKAVRTPILPANPEPAPSLAAGNDPISEVGVPVDEDDDTTTAEPLAPVVSPRASSNVTLLGPPIPAAPPRPASAPRGKGRPPSEGIAPVEDTREKPEAAAGAADSAQKMVSTGEWMSFGDNDELVADEMEGERWRRALRLGLPAAVFVLVAVLGIWGMSGGEPKAAVVPDAGAAAGTEQAAKAVADSPETSAAVAPAADAAAPAVVGAATADAAPPDVAQADEAERAAAETKAQAAAEAEAKAQAAAAAREKERAAAAAREKERAAAAAREKERAAAAAREKERAAAAARQKARAAAEARERQRARAQARQRARERSRQRARERKRTRERESQGSSDLPF